MLLLLRRISDILEFYYEKLNYMSNNNSEEVQLQNMINHLLLNASFINNLGLFNGKMGVALFFYYMAKRTQNNQYEEFAEYILQEIYDEIDCSTSIYLENGLAGIGCGLIFLIENQFIEGDINEVLEDIDLRIMEYDPLRLIDCGLNNGSGGLLLYASFRLFFAVSTNGSFPFDNQYRDALYQLAIKLKYQSKDTDVLRMADVYIQLTENKQIKQCNINLLDWLTQNNNDETTYQLGLTKGYAGKSYNLLKKNIKPIIL